LCKLQSAASVLSGKNGAGLARIADKPKLPVGNVGVADNPSIPACPCHAAGKAAGVFDTPTDRPSKKHPQVLSFPLVTTTEKNFSLSLLTQGCLSTIFLDMA
jgi:hypothetical protein